ncbi:MAG: c-type cytochrome [Rubrivivax sp.]|nr:MAG: c-type cytochrome [Rubrivivax sp.]
MDNFWFTAIALAAALLVTNRPARAADDKTAALVNAKGCVACHDVSTKKVGPAYRDVANKYAGQKDAVEKLTAKVLNGGSGVWGPVAMPPNKAMGVSEAEAKQLVIWVLSLKGAANTGTKNK